MAQIASAYYCPSTGRWLSRDPIGEPGFQALQTASSPSGIGNSVLQSPGRWVNRDAINESGLNLFDYPKYARASNNGLEYGFLQNNPIGLIDILGLMKWGKSCKQSDIDEMKKEFADRCAKANKGECFKCLGSTGARNMKKACDSKDGEGPEVECEDSTSSACKGLCGWTGLLGGIHICTGPYPKNCPGEGCTLLHEAAHSVGGVGSDGFGGILSGLNDNNAYKVENCAGCNVPPNRLQ